MKILVTGSTGFIGSRVVSHLASQGHQVARLLRKTPASGSPDIFWNPEVGMLDAAVLEGFDGVVHLAGDPIAKGRWTPEKKKRIRESRVASTSLLCENLAKLSRPPKALVQASAIGFYGERGNEVLTEESPPGEGFLPEVAAAWEKASGPALQKGIRVAHLRFGIVLSPAGGALAMMLPPFRMGLGGTLGSGRQFMSWISLEDVARIIEFTLTNDAIRGPINAVSPQPVTNLEFTKTLGTALKRPTIFPVPEFAVRLLFGEMGQDLLLSSARVEPKKLKAAGYTFHHPNLESAFREMFS
jgi:hypothetical protein